MKKFTALLLVLLLLTFSGCADTAVPENAVRFYYTRVEYVYGQPDGMIGSELRDVGSYENELRYLIPLYLKGPLSAGLRSPFPENLRLINLQRAEDTLLMKVSSQLVYLETGRQTLACACLAKTVFELTDVSAVRIEAKALGREEMVDCTITRDSFMTGDPTAETQES